MPTPALSRPYSRRASLRLAATALALAGLAGCATSEDTAATVDTLTAHLRQARADALTAAALAVTAPERAAALAVVETERTAHADALSSEIERVAGSPVTTTTAEPVAPGPPPTWDALKEALVASARSAADSARGESGYRAGLLGSISASCTVQTLVVLA